MSWNLLFPKSKSDIKVSDIISGLQMQRQAIHAIPVESIIGLFDQFRQTLSCLQHPLNAELRPLGLNYILEWMSPEHTGPLLDAALRGERRFLDEFLPFQKTSMPARLLHAQPRGLVVHWLSGNIPILGFLALMQAILTKNVSLVKASSDHMDVLPSLMSAFSDVEYHNTDGTVVRGSDVTRGIAVVYVSRDDRTIQEEISMAADVRIAWGGAEAIQTISGLPKKMGTEDVLFGPKYSFMVVGREYLQKVNLDELAMKAAFDVSVFDQQGCNSPHTILVEEGGDVTPSDFAEALGKAMAQVVRLLPKGQTTAAESLRILQLRAEYDMRATAYYSTTPDWTVLYSEDRGLAEACFSRVVFVRPISDVLAAVELASAKTQSVGVALAPERRRRFADAITLRGVERCPPIGQMSHHESPWDGVFLADRLVRWVTVANE